MPVLWLLEDIQDWNSSLLKELSRSFAIRYFDRVPSHDPAVLEQGLKRAGCFLVSSDTLRCSTSGLVWAEAMARKARIPVLDMSRQYRKKPCQRKEDRTQGFQKILIPATNKTTALICLLREILSEKNVEEKLLRFLDIALDPAKNRLFFAGQAQAEELTPKEAGILKLLLSLPGHCFSRQELQEQVWDRASISPRSIDSQVSRLRKKLLYSKVCISNRYGGGYILERSMIGISE